jgi:hypothetical protein
MKKTILALAVIIMVAAACNNGTSNVSTTDSTKVDSVKVVKDSTKVDTVSVK